MSVARFSTIYATVIDGNERVKTEEQQQQQHRHTTKQALLFCCCLRFVPISIDNAAAWTARPARARLSINQPGQKQRKQKGDRHQTYTYTALTDTVSVKLKLQAH